MFSLFSLDRIAPSRLHLATEMTLPRVPDKYTHIAIGGGDTDRPLNKQKRLRLIERQVSLRDAKTLDCGCGTGGYVLAFLCTPDGMPKVWAGKCAGFKEMDRVYGPNLMAEVCDWFRTSGHTHFLYGGAPGVAELLQRCLLFAWLIFCQVTGLKRYRLD